MDKKKNIVKGPLQRGAGLKSAQGMSMKPASSDIAAGCVHTNKSDVCDYLVVSTVPWPIIVVAANVPESSMPPSPCTRSYRGNTRSRSSQSRHTADNRKTLGREIEM